MSITSSFSNVTRIVVAGMNPMLSNSTLMQRLRVAADVFASARDAYHRIFPLHLVLFQTAYDDKVVRYLDRFLTLRPRWVARRLHTARRAQSSHRIRWDGHTFEEMSVRFPPQPSNSLQFA